MNRLHVSTGTEPLQGKRVAMVLFSYYPADPRPRRAAEALVAAGMKVDLICIRENQHDPKREVVRGVDVRRVPIARRRGGVLGYLYQYLVFLIASSFVLARRSFSGRYDLVYVNNMPDFLVLSGLIPKMFGARVILDLHDPMPELMETIFGIPQDAKSVWLLRRMEKWSIALADSVITVNRACARLFSTRSCSADKITVVMNSPDERIFVQPPPSLAAEKRNADRPFVVMYHGSLVERNGLGLAVDALAKISSTLPAVQLRIYGSRNAFLDRVMASVQKRGLERSVQYLGARSLEDIVEAIKECDLGIVPNERSIFTEINTPTRLFEYLALGKPVVAPRAPGILDYFDEESLIFFELGNAEDLARKIEFAFHNPDRIREITERGRQVHLTHTWSSERRILTGLVTDLLSNGVVPVSQQPTETISRKHARSPR